MQLRLRVKLYTRNPDNAALACQHYSTHLWYQAFSACPPSISNLSGRNPNKPAPFTSMQSITFCLLNRINGVESGHVPSRCSVYQESASGQVNWLALVMCFIFKFGMGSYILVTGEQPFRNHVHTNHSDLQFNPSPDHSGVRRGSESSILPLGAMRKVVYILCKLLLD